MRAVWIVIAIILLWLICHEHRITKAEDTLDWWETVEYDGDIVA